MSTRKAGILLTSVSAFLLNLSVALAFDFIVGEFEEIQSVSEEIMTKFPPNQYFYVGVGRSPTPFMAYIQAIDPTASVNIPISSFRARLTGASSSYHHPLSLEHEAKLNRHFMKLLNLEQIGNRKILLIDFSERGDTLISLNQYLSKYLRLTHKPNKVEMLALASPNNFDRIATNMRGTNNATVISLRERPLLSSKLTLQRYDPVAEYGAFHIWNPDARTDDLKPNEEFIDFRKSISRKLKPTTVQCLKTALVGIFR